MLEGHIKVFLLIILSYFLNLSFYIFFVPSYVLIGMQSMLESERQRAEISEKKHSEALERRQQFEETERMVI